MSVHTLSRTVATPADIEQLSALVAEPESALTDPPLHVPNAAGVLLALLVLSPGTPKEPRK
ncbi:hypothetical protein AB0425_14360 [Actinosynnema sp. NPDC051121]|nr:hypothetical protein [Saccharothrix sp.]